MVSNGSGPTARSGGSWSAAASSASRTLSTSPRTSLPARDETSEYGVALDHLADLGILPAEFVARFRAIAGFRNILVHGYLDVDLRVVQVILDERLEDFVEFARRVDAYLRKLPEA